MPVLRIACRAPWGAVHDVVVLQGRVIVPNNLGHDPSLWWLGDERHPHLAVTYLSVLEDETGAQLGLSPYCVPIERWNEAARCDSWLPMVPLSAVDGSLAQREGVTVLPTSPQLESLPIPRRAVDPHQDGDQPGSDRLRAASHAVSQLVGALRELVVGGILCAAIIACIYYLAAATIWLWSLRNGMTDAEIQDGILLIVAAVLFFTLTKAATKCLRPSDHVRRLRSDGGVIRPAHDRLLDAYRLGIALQISAFAGFVVW
jgi:hypothetical protein